MADRMRPSAIECIRLLTEAGVDTVMLTGDTEGSAEAVRKKVGITQCVARMKPSGKLDWITERQVQSFIHLIVVVAGTEYC